MEHTPPPEINDPHTHAIYKLVLAVSQRLSKGTHIKQIIDEHSEVKRQIRSIVLRNGDIQYTLERVERTDSGYSPVSGTSFRAELLGDRSVIEDKYDITTILKKEFQLPSNPESVEEESEDYLFLFSIDSLTKLTELINTAQEISM